MQAVIRTGAKQYLVELGQTLAIDLVKTDAKTLEFEPLLVIDGDKVTVGTPVVAGTTVVATIVGEVKGEKLQILKFKPKKRIKKRTGHRQHYTQVTISAIGSAKAPAAARPAKAAKPVAEAKPVTAAPSRQPAAAK